MKQDRVELLLEALKTIAKGTRSNQVKVIKSDGTVLYDRSVECSMNGHDMSLLAQQALEQDQKLFGEVEGGVKNDQG